MGARALMTGQASAAIVAAPVIQGRPVQPMLTNVPQAPITVIPTLHVATRLVALHVLAMPDFPATGQRALRSHVTPMNMSPATFVRPVGQVLQTLQATMLQVLIPRAT